MNVGLYILSLSHLVFIVEKGAFHQKIQRAILHIPVLLPLKKCAVCIAINSDSCRVTSSVTFKLYEFFRIFPGTWFYWFHHYFICLQSKHTANPFSRQNFQISAAWDLLNRLIDRKSSFQRTLSDMNHSHSLKVTDDVTFQLSDFITMQTAHFFSEEIVQFCAESHAESFGDKRPF